MKTILAAILLSLPLLANAQQSHKVYIIKQPESTRGNYAGVNLAVMMPSIKGPSDAKYIADFSKLVDENWTKVSMLNTNTQRLVLHARNTNDAKVRNDYHKQLNVIKSKYAADLLKVYTANGIQVNMDFRINLYPVTP